MWKHNSITSIGIDSGSKVVTFSASDDLMKLRDLTNKIIPFGYGSNTVIWDSCILVRPSEKYTVINDGGYTHIEASAGTELNKVVYEAVKYGINSNILNLAGIPGTVGGAIVQNSGAFGHTVADYIVNVTCWDNTGKCQVSLTKSQCRFSQRSSIFLEENNRYIILSARLRLCPDCDFYSAEELYRNVTKKREEKFPTPYSEPNSGSLFLPYVTDRYEIARQLPESKIITLENGRWKIPPGVILEKIGLKGKSITKNLYLSEKHSNFLCSMGSPTSEEWFEAVSQITETVNEQLNMRLSPEVNVIGNSIPSYVKALCRCRECYEI